MPSIKNSCPFLFFFFPSGAQTFSICPFHLASVLESQTSAWLTVLHCSKGQRTVAFLTQPFGTDRDTFVWRGLLVIFCIVLRTIIFYSTGPRPLWTTAAHARWIVGSWEHGGRASRQVWSHEPPHPTPSQDHFGSPTTKLSERDRRHAALYLQTASVKNKTVVDGIKPVVDL